LLGNERCAAIRRRPLVAPKQGP